MHSLAVTAYDATTNDVAANVAILLGIADAKLPAKASGSGVPLAIILATICRPATNVLTTDATHAATTHGSHAVANIAYTTAITTTRASPKVHSMRPEV